MPFTYSKNLIKHQLSNGLTVLIYPIKTLPKVALQLWFNVGSKDEDIRQKGIAHFLEHMVFKGTDSFSETDIIQITNKLAGDCNAFTGNDYTGYIFEFPKTQWPVGLYLLSQMMDKCTFKQDLIDSELAAVIQELKLYKDNYESVLEENMLSAIFDDHPYHYPIIGFKQDLWNITQQQLFEFYHKHYISNNATLVIVGDVDKDHAIAEVENYFADKKPNFDYSKPLLHCKKDVMAKEVIVYRDTQNPIACMSFVVPGFSSKNAYYLDLITWIVANGKGSRLYKKLVNELELVTDIEAYVFDGFDHAVFFIRYKPYEDTFAQAEELIKAEINSLIVQGFTQQELLRAIKQTEADYISAFEDYEELAYILGRGALATNDGAYALEYLNIDAQQAEREIKKILNDYFRTDIACMGRLVPLREKDRALWIEMQQRSDEDDKHALSERERHTPLEPLKVANSIDFKEPQPFIFPKYAKIELNNGLKILYCNSTTIPSIDVVLQLKANHYYDPAEKQGLHLFMMRMLLEGTKKYTADQLADQFELYGMSIDVSSGTIELKVLAPDLHRGLELLKEILENPSFDDQAIERVREQFTAEIEELWDNPSDSIDLLAKKYIYQNHQYAHAPLGTLESIEKITKDDLVNCYKQYITPQETLIAIAGDISNYQLQDMFNSIFGSWQGAKVAQLKYPELNSVQSQTINKSIHRDQMVLAFAAKSIDRLDPSFDKVLLFDQILTGAGAGSMSSKLFLLREESGLFYTIRGSLLAYASKQPGILFIKTIVSVENLKETQDRIAFTMRDALKELNEQELITARRCLISKFIESAASNNELAKSFLFLEWFGLPENYFDDRAEQLSKITVEQVQEAVHTIIDPETMVIIRLGRIDELKEIA